MPVSYLHATVVFACLALPLGGWAAPDSGGHGDTGSPDQRIAAAMQARAQQQRSETHGSVTVEGQKIDYKAVAGTLTLHGTGAEAPVPTAQIFYTAYFKQNAPAAKRPVTFIYNGGPGSASVWLHMGAFGPKRVRTRDDSHTPAAPYALVNNDYSLLNASDLVFIDAPGTGFSRLIAGGEDPAKRRKLMDKRKKHFYSVDGDAAAFAQFITQFLSQYQRWNSPKYLFGESYGTTRSAVLAYMLHSQDSVDLNGVILLSQILNFDASIDGPETNPGVDLPYVLALPSFAATAWYHEKLPGKRPAGLKPFLAKVEQFANGPYAQALAAGSMLDPKRKQQIARQMHQYTGLPVAYLRKASLRVTGGEFEKTLLSDSDDTTGRLDSRFEGPTLDPLSQGSQYDPQSAAISSAYVSLFNDYVRGTLHYGGDTRYRSTSDLWQDWDFKHEIPNADYTPRRATNVMPDLAAALKTNPNLEVMLTGGYFDLATPFYAAEYEMHHLPMPNRLQDNISYHFYQSGHMVYAHVPALKKLHDDVSRFIDRTDNIDAASEKAPIKKPEKRLKNSSAIVIGSKFLEPRPLSL